MSTKNNSCKKYMYLLTIHDDLKEKVFTRLFNKKANAEKFAAEWAISQFRENLECCEFDKDCEECRKIMKAIDSKNPRKIIKAFLDDDCSCYDPIEFQRILVGDSSEE